ncbi:carbohydrate kinase family protein [Candidatus Daviesbacteria bacterium]|nr:carbohydrate kinase family protein [Candidatus Daviesbacteria bacterium]
MITVTGSLAFDHIMDFPGKFSDHIMPDKIHQINLSFLVNTLQKQKGGTAGNIAYNLALLKNPVSILGAAGSDFAKYGQFLKNAGVDVSGIKIVDGESTSSAFITTDLKDNQLAAFYPGAMNQVHTVSIPPDSDFAVISPTTPEAMAKFVRECKRNNIPYLYDPGMNLPRISAADLKEGTEGATILIGNDYEISLLCDKLKVTSNKLLEQVKILITTLGEKGSIIQSASLPDSPSRSPGPPGRWLIKAAKPQQVMDPTGAGDAYRAGFLAGYLKGLDLKICGQMGSVAACYTVEKYGTTNHKFSLAEFKSRYRENFGEDLNV